MGFPKILDQSYEIDWIVKSLEVIWVQLWHLHVRLVLGKQALEGVQSTFGHPRNWLLTPCPVPEPIGNYLRQQIYKLEAQ